jgi:hypothetical protein
MQELLKAGINNFHVMNAVSHTSGAPWGLAVGGVFSLAMGLPLIIWPRKSTEVMWKINQGMRPWPIRKPPIGVTIAVGYFGVVLAVGLFVGLWASWP